jgi:hypothetical protein
VGKSHWIKVFDRAFDKAARLLPGQASNLTEEEDAVLLEAIRNYQARQDRALQWFLQRLKEQEIDLPHLEAKLLFKQFCMEGKIVC